MLEPAEAAARIVGAVAPLEPSEFPLIGADGLVLARDVVSRVSLPLWANSAMDGYACRADDIAQASAATPATLRVIEEVRAGAFPSQRVGPGEATRIATGAPVPAGADSVVRVEDTEMHGAAVAVRDARDARRNVRPAGEDVRRGDVVLTAGALIGPGQVALLASVGEAIVHAHPRPRVAIIATGDELVPLEQFDAVLAGQRIVSSNSYGLAAAVRRAGGVAVDGGIVRDDLAATRTALAHAAANADLIITSAGVSVGDADYLKAAVQELGGTVDFWRVRMRPGSPLAFGAVSGTPWLGLPGNPVSSLVTFKLFGRPAIRTLAGHRSAFARRVSVTVDEPLTVNTPLTHYLRVQLTPDGGGPPRARLAGPQASNILSSFARADALLVVPADREHVRAGEVLDAILLADGA